MWISQSKSICYNFGHQAQKDMQRLLLALFWDTVCALTLALYLPLTDRNNQQMETVQFMMDPKVQQAMTEQAQAMAQAGQ